jgi:hypothetical protein
MFTFGIGRVDDAKISAFRWLLWDVVDPDFVSRQVSEFNEVRKKCP